MGDGRPGVFDTYVHRLPLGVVGPVWHAQQGDGHSVQRRRRLVSAAQCLTGCARTQCTCARASSLFFYRLLLSSTWCWCFVVSRTQFCRCAQNARLGSSSVVPCLRTAWTRITSQQGLPSAHARMHPCCCHVFASQKSMHARGKGFAQCRKEERGARAGVA